MALLYNISSEQAPKVHRILKVLESGKLTRGEAMCSLIVIGIEPQDAADAIEQWLRPIK